MRRRRQHASLGMIAVTAAMVLTAPAVAQMSRDYDRCTGKGSPSTEQVIRGCTAVIQFKRETKTNRSISYNNRGNAYQTKGDNDRAIADYSEAIRLGPKNAGSYYNRGSVYEGKGDFDRTIADYNEAIRLDPKLSLAYYFRGLAWREKGDFDRAIADYSDIIRARSQERRLLLQPGQRVPRQGRLRPYRRRLRRGDPA
jgi:tetratricopeptide (TPR) repeat protein